MNKSPFEIDIDDQGDALRQFGAVRPPALSEVLRAPHDRIVLTGMGSSHFAALPTWRRLAEAGHSVWWVDSGQLLDTPGLVTADTLVVATSQSGASGEIAALVDPSTMQADPRTVIAVTNDPSSPLGRRADAIIELRSGHEATVSTKSYLNTLAAHQQIVAGLVGGPVDNIDETAKLVETFVPPRALAEVAGEFAATDNGRLAFVGNKDHASTALYAGLITKEAAKVAAEGYIGGQFRHGPLELAGPGLTAVLFGTYADDTNRSLHLLAGELVAAGSTVVLVGDLDLAGAHTIHVPKAGDLAALSLGSLVAQHFAVEIAKARGIEPGAFRFGQKVTTSL